MKRFFFVLATLGGIVLSACANRFECSASYFDMEFSPTNRGDDDLYILKIANSGRVTIRTRMDGNATAKPGEHFLNKEGKKLWRLKSVDVKIGKVIIEGIMFSCG
jgi:hypothetical protein